MNKDDRKKESTALATSNRQTLDKTSAFLVARGLSALSNWDAARTIEVVKAISSAGFEDDAIRILKDEIPEVVAADGWSLLLTDQDTQELRFEILDGKEIHFPEPLLDVRIKLGRGIAGWVAEKRQAVLVADAQKDSRFDPEVDGRTRAETRWLAVAPLRFQDQCFGVVELARCDESKGFSEADLLSLQTLADFTAIAIAKSRHTMKIHEMTITDEQTGLYNVRHLGFMLDTEISRSQRYSYEFSLVGIDFIGLRDSAASISYISFKELLAQITLQIKSVSRLIDFVFRYGDEDFMVLLPQTSKEGALVIAQRLDTLLNDAARLADEHRQLHLAAAVGLATYPADGKTATELIQNLDEALHRAKTRRTTI